MSPLALVFIAPVLVLLPVVFWERRNRKRERLNAYADHWAERGLRKLDELGELDRELSGDDL